MLKKELGEEVNEQGEILTTAGSYLVNSRLVQIKTDRVMEELRRSKMPMVGIVTDDGTKYNITRYNAHGPGAIILHEMGQGVHRGQEQQLWYLYLELKKGGGNDAILPEATFDKFLTGLEEGMEIKFLPMLLRRTRTTLRNFLLCI